MPPLLVVGEPTREIEKMRFWDSWPFTLSVCAGTYDNCGVCVLVGRRMVRGWRHFGVVGWWPVVAVLWGVVSVVYVCV